MGEAFEGFALKIGDRRSPAPLNRLLGLSIALLDGPPEAFRAGILLHWQTLAILMGLRFLAKSITLHGRSPSFYSTAVVAALVDASLFI
jgi:hypothetical protein